MSFYKGLRMALIATIASYGSYFFVYRMLKNIVHSLLSIKVLTKRHIAVITALAGSISVAFSNPFWFLNTRMTIKRDLAEDASAPVAKQSMMQMAKEIYNDEGIKAFYNGVLPGMILVINPIINFVVYESLVNLLKGKKVEAKAIHIFLASSMGKLLATLATYPILTCRVRLQANRQSGESKWKQLRKLLMRLSWIEYYRGMSAKLLQTILYNAFLLLTYEKMRLLIRKIIVASRK